MKISLIHPSRNRAEKARQTLDYWMSKASNTIEIEHILSIDLDDSQIDDYKRLFKDSTILISNNTCVVEATNIAAKKSTGDILIYFSDDFKCPNNWDREIFNAFSTIRYCSEINTPRLLKVDDCLQKFNVPVLTIPIMTRALYEKLGYFWHPEYRSMFCDEDLYWTCANNEWLIMCSHLKFPHEHPCNGLAENDETYKKSAANWDQGKAVFARRKAEGFPL